MRRETTRRKLEDLANRGFLKKIKGGYTLPAQTDAADYTKELRDFLVSKVRGLQNYIEKIPT
jgi:DeoR/GlpR family transcriptional regulator of sugar metabolism